MYDILFVPKVAIGIIHGLGSGDIVEHLVFFSGSSKIITRFTVFPFGRSVIDEYLSSRLFDIPKSETLDPDKFPFFFSLLRK